MSEPTPSDDKPQPPEPPPAREIREINSRDLMQGHREIVIRHGAEAYRLSITRSNKLILRK